MVLLTSKEGIIPAWEDENNANGGRWLCTCSTRDQDSAWLNLVIWALTFYRVSHTTKIVACIGEQGFSPYGSEICGINFSPRSDRISVWIRRRDSPSVLSIGSVVLASCSQDLRC